MATRRDKGPPRGTVRVKILPKDPLVAGRDARLGLKQRDMPIANASSGPCGPHAVVVDYNRDLDVRFAPAVLQANRSFRGLARRRDDALLADFQFHQVNVWAIVERTLAKLESDDLLGRPVTWANGAGRLLLLPHASYMENAFYDRVTGGLHFGYFEGYEGEVVYSCLSHDIVTHELGHAVLDGLKPGYNEVSSPETAGFHEYFGDAVAMMASLANRDVARVVVDDAPARLDAKNVVSAIASQFGAALRGLPEQDYLRGAWNKRTMADMAGKFEEHDWSEVLTGVYYELLQFLYAKYYKFILREKNVDQSKLNMRQWAAMWALTSAAKATAGVMFRGVDYCPPVDLRYADYAEAVLRAQEVAYPRDELGITEHLCASFAARGIPLPKHAEAKAVRDNVQKKLTRREVADATNTRADAYRFVDENRELFQIPYDANIVVERVYRTNKLSPSGYRPPREHIIEFTWSEDVALEGAKYGALDGTLLPLWCGGTLVFDTNSNFLHMSLALPTDKRRKEIRAYAAYLGETGGLAVASAARGIGAPSTGHARVVATLDNGRARLSRIAEMRHSRGED